MADEPEKKDTEEEEERKQDDNDDGAGGGILTNDTFRDLGVVETISEACDRLGWKSATQIQKSVIPDAIAGRDIIGLAETGSGKVCCSTSMVYE